MPREMRQQQQEIAVRVFENPIAVGPQRFSNELRPYHNRDVTFRELLVGGEYFLVTSTRLFKIRVEFLNYRDLTVTVLNDNDFREPVNLRVRYLIIFVHS